MLRTAPYYKRKAYQDRKEQGLVLVQVMLPAEAIAVLDDMGCTARGKKSRPAAVAQIVRDFVESRISEGDDTKQTP